MGGSGAIRVGFLTMIQIQAGSLSTFMKQEGPLAGNSSAVVYYAACVFFEKLRIKQGKGKSLNREMMEEIHLDGVDTTAHSGRVRYVIPRGADLTMDKYGRLGSSWW